MATLKEQMLADVAGVFMNEDEHATEATHHPDGGADAPVTVVVDFEKSSSGGRDGGGAHRELDRGQGVKSRGYIWVETSVTVTTQDHWTIDGVYYGVEDVGPPLEGLRKIGIVKWDGQHTTSPSSIRRGR